MFSFIWNVDKYFLLQDIKYLVVLIVSFMLIIALTAFFIKKSLKKSDGDES